MVASRITRPVARALAALAVVLLAAGSARADALVFHATTSGRTALDQGEGGGNPFASALIETLAGPVQLSELPGKLKRLTASKSQGLQAADVPGQVGTVYPLVPARRGEERIALVMIVSEYSASGGAPSLPGARHDADRIVQALHRAGFATELALDLDLAGMREKLAEFRERSQLADAAAIYTTGHGVEVDGTVFLIPGDYPIAERNAALKERALPLPEIARAPAARKVNLVFYGGCRDNPLGP